MINTRESYHIYNIYHYLSMLTKGIVCVCVCVFTPNILHSWFWNLVYRLMGNHIIGTSEDVHFEVLMYNT